MGGWEAGLRAFLHAAKIVRRAIEDEDDVRRTTVMLCAATLFAACSDGTSEPTFDAPEGCYDVTLGAWNTQADEVLPLPATVELRAELGTEVLEKDRRLVRPFPDTGIRSYRWSWWEPIEADSVRLIWSTGFTGIDMRLARRADGFAGRAENFLDYPGNVAQAEAVLRRRACAVPFEAAARIPSGRRTFGRLAKSILSA